MNASRGVVDELPAESESASARPGADTHGTGDAAAVRARQAPVSTTRYPSPDLRRILGLEVPVTVTLAERLMSVQSILDIRVGTIIEFDVPFDAELTLHVANQPAGKGHAVKSGENFGLRIQRIETVERRIEALGSHGSASGA